jgi:glucose-1-phosphate cytidylyltransferase
VKTVILCGGLGTRLSEETHLKPKPMIEIGGKPILWHILKTYEIQGVNDFILALGYKGDFIKDYFINYNIRNSNFTLNTLSSKLEIQSNSKENWNVSLIDTGLNTLTGGRLLRLKELINETFMLTYGDGLCDVDLKALINFHRSHKKIATVTSVRPPARFGEIQIKNGKVEKFKEKPQTESGWINGGYFIFEPEVFDYLDNDQTILENKPLENLANDGELMAYNHNGFWQCMDTIRDKNYLEEIIKNGNLPWLEK